MIAQLKLLFVKRARHLEHHVAEHQRGVIDGNFCLGFGDQFAVEIDQAYRRCHLFSLNAIDVDYYLMIYRDLNILRHTNE